MFINMNFDLLIFTILYEHSTNGEFKMLHSQGEEYSQRQRYFKERTYLLIRELFTWQDQFDHGNSVLCLAI